MHASLSLATVAAALMLKVAFAAAEPKVLSFDFTKQTARNTPDANRLRRRQGKTVNVNIDNADIAYLINMTIGTPPQMFTVQLDTGSADIWVPSINSDVCLQGPDACPGGAFDAQNSSSFKDIGRNQFSISYQDGSGSLGDYMNDTLVIGKTTVKSMTMGLATQASRALGLMGIGYISDESIASKNPDAIYPNIISQLRDQGYTNTLAYSLWLNDPNSRTGSILFGGLDTAKFHGPLTVLPIQKGVNGAYKDFTVAMSSFGLSDPNGKNQYQQQNLALPVILDSGTTATYLPDNIANDVLNGVGAIDNPDYGFIVPCNIGNSPDVFSFGFGGAGGPTINVPFGEFTTPIYNLDGSQPQFKDGSGAVCTWGLLSSGAPDQPILLGDTFLRSAYVVYDLSNNQIGIAQTNFNATASNPVEIKSGTSIPGASATATLAAAQQSYTGIPLEQGHTKTAGAAFTGGRKSPTFNLGTASATGKSKSAAPALAAPRVDVAAVVGGVLLLISVGFGGSLIRFM